MKEKYYYTVGSTSRSASSASIRILFGFEKKIKIPYSHVTCVTKENTAVFIPNAIAVITARKEYVVRSFWDRDDCFNLLRAYHEMYRTVLEPASSHVEEEETQQQESKEEEKFETHVETPVARQESLPQQDLLKRIEGIAGPDVQERPATPDVADTPEHARTTAKAFSLEVHSTKLAETLHTCHLTSECRRVLRAFSGRRLRLSSDKIPRRPR